MEGWLGSSPRYLQVATASRQTGSQDFGWRVTFFVIEGGGHNGRMMSPGSSLLSVRFFYSFSPQIFTRHWPVPGFVLSASGSEQDLPG